MAAGGTPTRSDVVAVGTALQDDLRELIAAIDATPSFRPRRWNSSSR
jgi:hypothetical protein